MYVLNCLHSANLSLWVTSSASRSSESKKTREVENAIENVDAEGISDM